MGFRVVYDQPSRFPDPHGEVRFLIFFDTPDVQDIGLTGCIPAFPARITGPTLGLSGAQLAKIPPLPSDLLLVRKVNPVAK